MNGLAALQPVAELLGIATRHVDALGVVHNPSPETLERFIAAFGLPAEPERAAAAIIEARQAAPLGLDPLEMGSEAYPNV